MRTERFSMARSGGPSGPRWLRAAGLKPRYDQPGHAVGRRSEGGLVRRSSRESGRAAVRWREGGYSFIELIVVTAILMILASAVMPLAQVTSQRQREVELRAALRQMRTAIDRFKDAVDANRIAQMELKPGSEGYPPDLETLVEGVPIQGDQSGARLKFLRKIPIDPMTNSTEWGLRSYQDKPDSTSWSRQNVYDVYTTSDGTALNGTKYKDW